MLRAAPASMAAAASPGLVLRITSRVVRIVVRVVAGEDLGGRARRGVDPLIGVATGEDKRRDCEDDGETHGGLRPKCVAPVSLGLGRDGEPMFHCVL